MGRVSKNARKASPVASRKVRRKTPFWERLVEQLQDLEIDIGVFQAQITDQSPACVLFLSEDEGDGATKKNSDLSTIDESVYWFILITNALKALLPLSSEEDALAATDLVLQWTDLFTGQKLNSTATCRSLLGHAVMVVTEVCTQAISRYHDNMEIMLASIISLDAVSVAGSYDKTDWSNGVVSSWRDYLNTTEHIFPTKKTSWTKLEACLDAFESKDFNAFLQMPRLPLTDVRLALKRWSPVFITWFGGQEIICKALLEMVNAHADYSGCERVLPLSNSKKNRSVVCVPVPSVVTLLTMIGRLCRILSTGSSVGGSKGPGGNFTLYAKEISGRVESTPENDQSFSLLLQTCLQRHAESTPNWVQADSTVVNCMKWKVPESTKLVTKVPVFFSRALSFYPFMENLVTDIVSLVSNKILRSLSMNWILKGPIKDVSLCRWAILPITADMELMTATSEPLNTFQAVSSTPKSPPAKTKLRKRKKDASFSEDSEFLSELLGNANHSQHECFALFLRLTPNIADSLLRILGALYDSMCKASVAWDSSTNSLTNQREASLGRPGSHSQMQEPRTRIQNVRTVLELIKALIKFDISSCSLRGLLASKFGWEELRQLVLYAPMLTKALARQLASKGEATIPAMDALKSLWEYHAGLLAIIGRQSFRQDLKQTSFDEWKKLLSKISDQSFRHSESSWPLTLDPCFQILVGTNLQHHSPGSVTSSIIVEGIVTEMRDVFSSLDTFAKFMESRPRDKPLLALNYSRMVLLSFSKLETSNQNDALRAILNVLKAFLETERSLVQVREEAFGMQFIARVITLCFSGYVIMRFRREANSLMREFKFESVAAQQTDETYLGLFAADSFSLPLLDVDSLLQDDASVSSLLQDVIQQTFELAVSGERYQKDENLVLAFAAYNALGLSTLWNSGDLIINQGIALDEVKLPLVVLQLRSDMLLLKAKRKKFQKLSAANSTLERLLMMKLPNITVQTLKSDIKALLRNAMGVIESFMTSYDEKATTPIAFVALDTASSCVTFALSCCTTSQGSNDIVSILSERSRTDSIESDDHITSDEGSIGSQGSKPTTDGATRLRNIIDAISSAPCHPDWLDNSCSLLRGLNPYDIMFEVGNALKCFRRLVDFSRNQTRLTRMRLLKEHNSSLTDKDVEIIVDLLGFQEQVRQSTSSDHSSMDGLLSTVSLAFDCQETFLQRLSHVEVSRGFQPWELIAEKCTHLSRTDDNSMKFAYHRATGNWEAILALALVVPTQKIIVNNSNEDEGCHRLQMWTTLQEHAVSNMIPATALFRFALAYGGRRRHPLVYNVSGPAGSALFFKNADGGDGFPVHAKQEMKKQPVVALWILDLLAELPLSNASRSIANHLMKNQEDFLVLNETARLELSFNILVALNSRANDPLISRLADQIARDISRSSNKAIAASLGASAPIAPVVVDQLVTSLDAIPRPEPERVRVLLQNMFVEISGKTECPSSDRINIASKILSTALDFGEEHQSSALLDVVVRLLSESAIDDLATLVRSAFCNFPEECQIVRSTLTMTLGRVFAKRSFSTTKMALVLWPIVKVSLDDVYFFKYEVQESIICVAILCCLQCNKVIEFGSVLMSLVTSTTLTDPENAHHHCQLVKIFFSFVAGLGHALKETEVAYEKNPAELTEKGEVASSRFPALCTYVTDNDFQDQHWYNCGTCGLVGDKGCCSLCAVVCHSGHEVWYSRYGSFLCDCGEMSINCSDRRQATRCQCLTQQARDKFMLPEQFDGTSTEWEPKKNDVLNVKKSLQLLDLSGPNRQEILQAYDEFTAHDATSLWTKSLFDIANKALHRWQHGGTASVATGAATSETLCGNTGDSFLDEVQTTIGFNPRASTVQSKPMGAIAYNRKGHLVVAEDGFLSAYGWYLDYPETSESLSPFPIPLFKISSTAAVVGLTFSPWNDEYLLYWGDDGVKLGQIDATWKTFKKIWLITDVGEKIEAVVGCSWVLEQHVLVWTRCHIYLFEVEEQADLVSLCQKVACAVPPRDVVVLSSSPVLHSIFAAQEDGKVLKLSMSTDESGKQHLSETSSETLIDNSLCRTLLYIPDKRLLLCEASDAGIFSTTVGHDLKLGPRVALLPPKLDILGKEKRLGAPYSQMRYLGLTKDGDGTSFQTICCLATKSSKKGPLDQLVVIRFNKRRVVVDECNQEETRIVGLAACSFPDMKQYTEKIVVAALLSREIRFSIGNTGHHILNNIQPTAATQKICRKRVHGKGGGGLLPFEDMRNATACPSMQYRTTDSTLESDSLKLLFSADHTGTLVGKSSEGFSIFVFRVPCKDDANINGDAIVALRILLGSSPDSTPTEATVLGRKIVVDKKYQRWYSIILNPVEVATVARTGFISVGIGPTERKSHPPVVDGLEVYVDNQGGSEFALPFCLSRVDNTSRQNRNRDILLFLLQSLRDLKMKTLGLKASRAEKSLIRKVVEATALSSDLELGDVAFSMISSIEGDLRSRLAYQDKSILKACFLFLSRCKSRLDQFHGKQRLLEWISLNPLLRSCLRASSGIARTRPYNFLQIADESSGEIRSLASDASALIVNFLTNFPSNDSLLADLVDVLLFELAVVSGTPRGRFGSFEGLRMLLSSTNDRVVRLTCKFISNFCEENDIFSAQKMAIEYVCDSCLRVIANTRFSVQVSDAVFDLCLDCFAKGQEFAHKQENGDTYVLIGGRTIGSSPKLTCATLLNMRGVEKTSSRNASTVDDDDTSHRQQLHAAFMDGLCHGLGSLLQQKLSHPSRQIIQFCADLIRHGFGTRKGSTDAKTLLLSLVNNLELRLSDGTDMSYGRLHAVGLLLEGLASIIVKDKHARRYLVGTESQTVSCDAVGKPSEVACPTHLTRCRECMFTGGANKGRRFYCCESGESCLFFKWKNDRACQDSTIPSENLRGFVLEVLKQANVDGQSVLMQLRAIVSQFVFSPVEREEECCATTKTDENHKRGVMSSGILCHLTQFNGTGATDSLANLEVDAKHDSPHQSQKELMEAIVQSSLEILVLTACANTKLDDPWLPLLSRIALGMEDTKARPAATTAIRSMVGKSKHRSVLEHFSHVLQSEKLADSGRPLLQYAIILTKKAAICAGMEQQEGLDQVDASALIGMNHLVSDNLMSSNGQVLCNAVNEILLDISKAQQRSWSTFCSNEHVKSERLEIAPVRIVFCLVCTCPSQLRGKLLRLLNAAVNTENGRAVFDILRFSNLSLVCFVRRFVLKGFSADVRNTAAQIVSKFFSCLGQKDRLKVLRLLSAEVMTDVGKIGRRSSDFFCLLHGLLRILGDLPDEDVEYASSYSFNCFASQLISTVAGRANGDYSYLETRTSSAYQKRRFELSKCASCRLQIKSKSKTDFSKKDKTGTSALLRKTSADSSKQKTSPEQITPFLRGRLAVNRESTVSDEFSTFISLKHRIAISAIHLEVENARREVKQINMYFSPRPVDNVEKLKSPEYSEKWKLCATLTLSKTAGRVTVTLPSPVVAANLRIEYAEFADRCGTTENGKVILSCPRCSGNVTNAHGLCTTCGEIAFQCRKCRHINYDRLDAFLCVECGYCASGTFRFDLTAGYATNAIAITNDVEYDRTKEMLKVARSCHENLRTALRQRLALLMGTKRKDNILLDDSSLQLRRAFGENLPIQFREADFDDDYSKLTVSDIGKAGTVVQRVASHESSLERWPPTCSRLGTVSSGNDEADGTMTRAVNDDGEEESTSDIISNLLENGGLGGRYASGLDSNDPLSRLLASVRGSQPRIGRAESKSGTHNFLRVAVGEDGKSGGFRRSENKVERGSESHDEESPPRDRSSNGNSNTKASIEVCDRLYLLMQEAEREVYELEERCNAWERLNSGNLSLIHEQDDDFEPSHCCACQPSIAIQLLTWWHALFKKAPGVVPVTKEMIQTLLGEQLSGHSSSAKTLQARLRDVISDVALLSPEGRKIVLDLLRDRMQVFGDSQSAEVLGCILERMGGETEISAPFLALAQEALGSFRG